MKTGYFKLSSGGTSRVYVDLRGLPSRPEAFRPVAAMLAGAVAAAGLDRADVVVGVATGGVPWAAALAGILWKPLAYVRPERKAHGMGRSVEGSVEGRSVIVVDDVATTGSSLRRAIDALRDAGARVQAAVVVVDREQGASEGLAGVSLLRLATLRDVIRAGARLGFISREEAEDILGGLGRG